MADPIRLYSIKNFGNEIANVIIDEQEKSGKFSSFADFLRTDQAQNLNKKSLEALIKSGHWTRLRPGGNAQQHGRGACI